MRRFGWMVIAIIVVLLILAIFMPPLMGVLFERSYQNLVRFYNNQGNVQLQIVEYKRGWLYSKAIVNVKIANPEFLTIIQKATHQTSLPVLAFTITQHIQHGPIIYENMKMLPRIIGLAAIQNSVQLSPSFEKTFQALGISEIPVKIDNDLISFTGRYFKRLEFMPFRFTYPDSATQVALSAMQGSLWIWPRLERLKGKLNLAKVSIFDNEQNITVADLKLQFDQKRDSYGLWLGNSSVRIPEFIMKAANDDLIVVTGLELNESLDESNGELHGFKDIVVKNLQVNDQMMGSLSLQLSMHGVNAQAIANLINTYETITKRGEMYESQLRRRLFAVLPSIFNAGAHVNLHLLKIITPNGVLTVKGEMALPNKNFVVASSLKELYQTTRLQMDMHISRKLAYQAIDLIANYFYVYQLSWANRAALTEIQDNIYFISQQNYVSMVSLVQNKLISNQYGKAILNLQKKAISPALYSSIVKQLFNEKQISREVSYSLYWQYAILQQQLLLLKQQEDRYKTMYAQKINAQLADFIKKGYVIQYGDDLILSVVREEGVLKMNGKKFA